MAQCKEYETVYVNWNHAALLDIVRDHLDEPAPET